MARETVVLYLLYLVAGISGILAVFLPFWISTAIDEGVKEIPVERKIDSGLFWKYERYEVKDNALPESDSWFKKMAGSSFDTRNVLNVKALMLTGMVLLTVSFICSNCVSCCCIKEDQQKTFIGIAVMLFISALLVAVGVIIYFTQVLEDHKLSENEDHLGVSFWLAVCCSFATFATGVYTCYQACHIEKRK